MPRFEIEISAPSSYFRLTWKSEKQEWELEQSKFAEGYMYICTLLCSEFNPPLAFQEAWRIIQGL